MNNVISDRQWKFFNWPGDAAPSNARGVVNSLLNLYPDAVEEVDQTDPYTKLALEGFLNTAMRYSDVYREVLDDEWANPPTLELSTYPPIQGWARELFRMALLAEPGEYPVAQHPLFVIAIEHVAQLCQVNQYGQGVMERWEIARQAMDDRLEEINGRV